jgi:1,4-alpha-glucan branching enzyme
MTGHGYLALVLHAHLPYVHHPEYPEFLEEDWLFEAITETYLPLLDVFDRLVRDGVPFALTLTLTPPLCAMLRNELLRERYLRYVDRALILAERETERTRGQGRLEDTAHFYLEHLRACRIQYVERWQGDLVAAFRGFQDSGHLEIITCAATHGLLPLMENIPQAVRAQIRIARDDYRECFGRDPNGIWLPECAYVSGIDQVLQEANIRWFVLDSHGLMFGQPRPRRAIYAPCFTPAGPAAFSRDRESSRQVWSAQHGYPGDPAYRDFYRDIGFELPPEQLEPVIAPGAARKFTGFKYHRITGRTADKDLYHRVWAMSAADSHAGHFMDERRTQIGKLREVLDVDPIVVAPFDAELFGHWWYEGPQFLELFLRKTAYDQNVFELTTPGRYLTGHGTLQVVAPSASSWGQNGYWEVWLHETNAWIYPHLQTAARRMVEAAQAETKGAGFAARAGAKLGKDAAAITERLLKQMARELLLAQSSDWAFLMKTGTATHYAAKRTRDHVLRFTRLYEQWRSGALDLEFLANCEWRDDLFPHVNWRYYV